MAESLLFFFCLLDDTQGLNIRSLQFHRLISSKLYVLSSWNLGIGVSNVCNTAVPWALKADPKSGSLCEKGRFFFRQITQNRYF